MKENFDIQWCQCEHTDEEQHKTCEVVCICKKCGKPIRHLSEDTHPQRQEP